MALEVLIDASFIVHSEDLSGVSNEVTVEHGVEPLEANRFQVGTKINAPGLFTGRISAKGYTDYALPALDDFIWQAGPPTSFGAGSAEAVITAMPKVGDNLPAYGFRGMIATYQTLGEVGALFPYNLETNPATRLVRGTNILFGQKTVTGSGTARQLGAIAANQRLYAALNVVQFNGASLVMRLRSDDNGGMGTPTTRITFNPNPFTAKGADWQELAGAITDDWWQADWTFTGTSFTAFMLVAILTLR